MNLVFTPTAWRQYTDWQSEDKRMVKRINDLIKDIMRNGALTGIGKPEALKHIKMCSRRITDEHRLTYNVDTNDNLIIYSCKGHYTEV
jgi:toxin YoeB